MNKKLLKVSEVAEMLSITTAQVLRLVRSRRLPAIRISPRCTRFRPDSIQRFLEDPPREDRQKWKQVWAREDRQKWKESQTNEAI